MWISRIFAFFLAGHLVAAFSSDGASRADPAKATSKANNERLLLPLGIVALWKLRPFFKTLNGYGSFGGTFGATFGGGGGVYNQVYPFPGAFGAAGASSLGLGGGGYPGAYPGYPFPAIAGPGPFNIRGNKPGDVRPNKSTTIVEDGRIDVIDDPVTTIKPGLAESIVAYASPFFHAGQRVEYRSRHRRQVN